MREQFAAQIKDDVLPGHRHRAHAKVRADPKRDGREQVQADRLLEHAEVAHSNAAVERDLDEVRSGDVRAHRKEHPAHRRDDLPFVRHQVAGKPPREFGIVRLADDAIFVRARRDGEGFLFLLGCCLNCHSWVVR